jgi:hypothetical protein
MVNMWDAAAANIVALEASHATTIVQLKEALTKSERDNTALKASYAALAAKLECANISSGGGGAQQLTEELGTKITTIHAAVTTLRALEIQAVGDNRTREFAEHHVAAIDARDTVIARLEAAVAARDATIAELRASHAEAMVKSGAELEALRMSHAETIFQVGISPRRHNKAVTTFAVQPGIRQSGAKAHADCDAHQNGICPRRRSSAIGTRARQTGV